MKNIGYVLLFVLFIIIQGSCDKLSSIKGESTSQIEEKQKKGTGNPLPEIADMAAFKKKPFLEQNKYFDKLNETDKFRFLRAYLPGEAFRIPPNEEILFLCTGDMLFAGVGQKGLPLLMKWKIKANVLQITGSRAGIMSGTRREGGGDIRGDWIRPKGSYSDVGLSLDLYSTDGVGSLALFGTDGRVLTDLAELKLIKDYHKKIAACK